MTTARDVIAGCFRSDEEPMMYDSPHANADRILAALISAPESARLNLVALLNPWRPIETAPKRVAVLLHNKRNGDWWLGTNDTPYVPDHAPTHWQPLPAPPSEDVT